MAKVNKDTGRYDIGQEIIVANIVHNHFAGGKVKRTYEKDFCSYLDKDRRPVSVIFKKLKVVEHRKVPELYDDDQIPNHDGYILVDEDGNRWLNQYPYAYYGQLSTPYDSLFQIQHDDVSKIDRSAPFSFEAYSVDFILERLKVPSNLKKRLEMLGNKFRKLHLVHSEDESPLNSMSKSLFHLQNNKAILLTCFMEKFGKTHEIKNVVIHEGVSYEGKPYKITCEKVVKKEN